MISFHCNQCGVAILDSERGYVTGCQHFPLEPDGGWIDVATSGMPDFREFGFQSGKSLDVRRESGEEVAGVIYQGYGLFGTELFQDVTHWRSSR